MVEDMVFNDIFAMYVSLLTKKAKSMNL